MKIRLNETRPSSIQDELLKKIIDYCKSALFGDKRGLIKTFAILTAENPMSKKMMIQKINKEIIC